MLGVWRLLTLKGAPNCTAVVHGSGVFLYSGKYFVDLCHVVSESYCVFRILNHI